MLTGKCNRLVGMVAALALVCAGRATAGELLDRLATPHHPAPTQHNSVNRYAAVPPGHQRYYVYNVEEYPWLNHGLAVPTYNWGYFGAHSRPIFSAQHPDSFYYHNAWQWTFRPAD